MTADALAEETEQLKLTSEEHCRVIAKQKALYNKTIAEYQQLDKYVFTWRHISCVDWNNNGNDESGIS
jgi:hypothetical protein